MGFRRAKSREQEKRKPRDEWIARNRSGLDAIGLPPEVYLSPEHWEDFLENGYLEWHQQDGAGFAFDHLSSGAAGALLRFLGGHYGEAVRCPPLLGWLRERRRQGRIP
jgi:hypothetical protein